MIRIGPAGTGMDAISGLNYIAKLGLTALEVEFTHGVRMSNETAVEVGKLAKQLNIALSIHAPYYINLASKEKKKIEESKKRILDSCERGHNMHAKYVVFHAGFYQERNKEEVFQIIKDEILDLQKKIKQKSWNIILAPETTGKLSQFGDLGELLRLKKETDCHLCIDFAHLKARNNGKIDLKEIFDKIMHIGHIHSHFSGINYTEKGEKNHIPIDINEVKVLATEMIKIAKSRRFLACSESVFGTDSDIKKRKLDITIINESPDTINDAVKIKEIFEKI